MGNSTISARISRLSSLCLLAYFFVVLRHFLVPALKGSSRTAPLLFQNRLYQVARHSCCFCTSVLCGILYISQWSLYVPHSGHYMYRTVITICTAQWSLYVPHSGHYMYHQFNIQQFHVLPTHTVFMCFVWISEQTAIISLYSINCGLYN
jgi:hypothetical protein